MRNSGYMPSSVTKRTYICVETVQYFRQMAILEILFVGASVLQGFFWGWVFPKASAEDTTSCPSDAVEELAGVSLLLCFRNEAARLAKYVPLLLAQEYPHFELLAVDDYSTDRSAEIIAALAAKDSRLRLIRPPQPTRAGKKDALSYGISQAKYPFLLLTDADCAPSSDTWLRQMTAPLRCAQAAKNLVLGYSPYRALPAGGWLNDFQRFETRYTAFQYLGLARIGYPYMGVGRNMAYHRSFFEAAGGFQGHAHLPGGDDDLLVGQQAEDQSTALITQFSAWAWSEPSLHWRDYLGRKFRHISVGAHYRPVHQILLGALAVSHVLHYASAAMLLFWEALGLPLLGMGLRWSLLLACFRRPFGQTSSPNDLARGLASLLRNDLMLVFYYLLLSPALLFGQKAKGGW